MATMEALRNTIKRITRNKAYTDTDLLALMNNAINSIAGGMMFKYADGVQAMSPPLPDLMSSATLTTSTTVCYVALPTNFQRNLFMLLSATQGTRIHNLFPSFVDFLTYYPAAGTNNLTCSVIAAARNVNLLWYQGVPTTSETLTVHYHRKPTPITEATITSEPDGLPSHMHEELVVNYCGMKIWKEIESGVGAGMVNTMKYEQWLEEALRDLDAFCPVQRESVVFSPDHDRSYWST